MDEEGAPIAAAWRDVTDEPKTETPKAEAPTPEPAAPEAPQEEANAEPEPQAKEEAPAAELTLYDLVQAGWTPEQITKVNDGRIPGTSEEVRAVNEKLEAQ